MPWRGMRDQSGRFIDNDQMWIFEDDVKRYVFAKRFRGDGVRYGKFNDSTRLYFVGWILLW